MKHGMVRAGPSQGMWLSEAPGRTRVRPHSTSHSQAPGWAQTLLQAPGALGDVPQALLGGPSEPQLPGLHHENYPFPSLQCCRDYMRACMGRRASKLAHGRGSVVERGRLSVQRGGNKGPAETGDRRHRQGSDQRRAFNNADQGLGAAEETGWSSRMAEVRCRAEMEPGLWPEGSNGSAVAKARLVQMGHWGRWSGSPCPSLRSPRERGPHESRMLPPVAFGVAPLGCQWELVGSGCLLWTDSTKAAPVSPLQWPPFESKTQKPSKSKTKDAKR